MNKLAGLVLVLALMAIAVPRASAVENPMPSCNGVAATIVWDGLAESIEGTEGDDVIVGTSGKDVINGNGGNDLICGRGRGDRINGGDGNDVIFGQGGHDRIHGGKGDDLIRGGRGNDMVWGNRGNDTALGSTGSDVCVAERESNCELDKRWGHEPDDWLPLLEEYFGDIGETTNALSVLGCESNGEPFIRGPQTPFGRAMGLFQFMPGTWKRWNPETPGWAGESPFHPEANIATARRLYDAYVDWDGRWGWTPWSCNRLLDRPR